MDGQVLFFSLIFSIIGMGYFAHSRKNHPMFLLPGVALMVYPYFVSSFFWLIAIGVLLSVLPLFLDRYW